MCVIIFCRDSFEKFDPMLVLICFALLIPLIQIKASVDTDKSIFYLPNYASVSYNTESKNIVTKTLLFTLLFVRHLAVVTGKIE